MRIVSDTRSKLDELKLNYVEHFVWPIQIEVDLFNYVSLLIVYCIAAFVVHDVNNNACLTCLYIIYIRKLCAHNIMFKNVDCS